MANAILALIFSFSSPTFRSIIKDMVDKNRISHYNSIANAGKELIGMVAPAIGLVLLDFVGARIALLINAATFAISAFSECLMKELDIEEKREASGIKVGTMPDL